MAIDSKLQKVIVDRILSVTQPEKIILFGSAATDRFSPDSDIDILVLEKTVQNQHEERVRIRASLRGLGYPFDIIVMGSERFEESKNVVGGIAYPANKYGWVIYDAA